MTWGRLGKIITGNQWVPVSNRQHNSYATTTTGTYGENGNARAPLYVTKDGTGLRVRVDHFTATQTGSSGSGTETLPSNSMTFKAAWEMADGTVLPLHFNGLREVTIDPGGHAWSDPLAVAVTAGDLCYLRYRYDLGASGVTGINQKPLIGSSAGGGLVTGTVGAPSADLVDSGSITSTTTILPCTWTAFTRAHVPVRSTLLLGDSIMAGAYHSILANDYGFGVLAMHGNSRDNLVSGAAKIPYARIAIGSQRLRAFVTGYRRIVLGGHFDDAIVALGTNDFGPETSAQVIADLTALTSMLHDQGARVHLCTIIPLSTSSDDWYTVAGQTTDTNNGKRNVINDAIRSLACGHDSFFEIAATVETERGSGLWIAPSIIATGTATGGSTTTIVNSGAGFPATSGHWSGYRSFCVRMTSGSQSGEVRLIASSTSTQLNIHTSAPSAAFGGAISAGDTYAVIEAITLDGIHPLRHSSELMAGAIDLSRLTW